jgi:glutamate 5-kinase
MSASRSKLAASRRWVIKVGSSLVTAKGTGLDQAAIADWCAQIASLRAAGVQVVLVSSGAVAEGMARLGLKKRPADLHALQARLRSARWAWSEPTRPSSSNMA